jgi:maltose O-acetyltransferase
VRFGAGVTVHAAPGAQVVIGDHVEIGSGTHISAQAGTVHIGDRVFISGLCIIAGAEHITIGAESMLAEMVCVRDHDHDPDEPPRSGRVLTAPVVIGERVWIASKASVVRGGEVGDDTVIGAHALVNRPIPGGVIAVGVPAKVARKRR